MNEPLLSTSLEGGSGLIVPVSRNHSKWQDYRDSHNVIINDDEGGSGSGKKLKKSRDLPRTATFWQASLNTIKVIVGAGIPVLPYTLKESGWAGIAVLVGLLVLASYTARLLGRLQKMPNGDQLNSYPDIAERAFGRVGRLLMTFVFIPEIFLALSMFLFIAAQGFQKNFPIARSEELVGVRLWGLMIAAFVLPTTWFRSMAKLSFLSFFGVVAVLFFLAALVYCIFLPDSAIHIAEGGGNLNNTNFNLNNNIDNNNNNSSTILPREEFVAFDFGNVPISYGLTLFCLAGHVVFPSIKATMRQPKQFDAMINVSFLIIGVLYLALAILGYLAFGAATLDNVLESLPRGSGLTFASSLAMNIQIVLSYALVFHPLASLCEELFGLPVPEKARPHYVRNMVASMMLRTFLVIGTFGVAYFTKKFYVISSLTGGVLSAMTSVFFPLACYIKVFYYTLPKVQLFLLSFVFLICVALTTAWAVGQVQDLIKTFS